MERLTPPPSGRLVPKIWTQWPLSPRLIKSFGPEAGPSNPQENNDSNGENKVGESVPAETEPLDDEKAKGNPCSCYQCNLMYTYFGYRTERYTAAQITVARSYETKARQPSQDRISRRLQLDGKHLAV